MHWTTHSIKFVIIALLLLCVACNEALLSTAEKKAYTNQVTNYIKQGDDIYKTKANATTFSTALIYYDSALLIAQKSNLNTLIAKAHFAKGRAYDAWNHDPLKTIEYFLKAENFYSQLDSTKALASYIGHLVAHTFEKNNDSINAINKELEVLKSIPLITDSNALDYKFLPEMSLSCVLVNNYDLAEEILQKRFQRKYIFNDSTTYNYLDHYYFAKAIIDVKKYNNAKSSYLDSATQVYNSSALKIDKTYYGEILIKLYTHLNKIPEATQIINTIPRNDKDVNAYIRLNAADATFRGIQTGELQRNLLEKERQNKIKNILIGLLTLFIAGVIAALITIARNRKKIKTQKQELELSNNKLNAKVVEVEWLNKEIHHRVKNNLQIIQGLVYMQENAIDDEKTKAYLLQIRTRIDSIATLHKQLMLQDTNVNLKEYVTKITATLASLLGNNKQIITHLDVDDIDNTIKANFTLGLIINELVTNSIKYCNTQQLTIHLSIKNIPPNSEFLEFNYSDSNTAVPTNKEIKGIGLQIIDLLQAQINAEKISTENPYSCNFRINLSGH